MNFGFPTYEREKREKSARGTVLTSTWLDAEAARAREVRRGVRLAVRDVGGRDEAERRERDGAPGELLRGVHVRA